MTSSTSNSRISSVRISSGRIGIPVYVWMKWRQTPAPVELEQDFDRHLLGRSYTRRPVPHDDLETNVPASRH